MIKGRIVKEWLLRHGYSLDLKIPFPEDFKEDVIDIIVDVPNLENVKRRKEELHPFLVTLLNFSGYKRTHIPSLKDLCEILSDCDRIERSNRVNHNNDMRKTNTIFLIYYFLIDYHSRQDDEDMEMKKVETILSKYGRKFFLSEEVELFIFSLWLLDHGTTPPILNFINCNSESYSLYGFKEQILMKYFCVSKPKFCYNLMLSLGCDMPILELKIMLRNRMIGESFRYIRKVGTNRNKLRNLLLFEFFETLVIKKNSFYSLSRTEQQEKLKKKKKSINILKIIFSLNFDSYEDDFFVRFMEISKHPEKHQILFQHQISKGKFIEGTRLFDSMGHKKIVRPGMSKSSNDTETEKLIKERLLKVIPKHLQEDFLVRVGQHRQETEKQRMKDDEEEKEEKEETGFVDQLNESVNSLNRKYFLKPVVASDEKKILVRKAFATNYSQNILNKEITSSTTTTQEEQPRKRKREEMIPMRPTKTLLRARPPYASTKPQLGRTIDLREKQKRKTKYERVEEEEEIGSSDDEEEDDDEEEEGEGEGDDYEDDEEEEEGEDYEDDDEEDDEDVYDRRRKKRRLMGRQPVEQQQRNMRLPPHRQQQMKRKLKPAPQPITLGNHSWGVTDGFDLGQPSSSMQFGKYDSYDLFSSNNNSHTNVQQGTKVGTEEEPICLDSSDEED